MFDELILLLMYDDLNDKIEVKMDRMKASRVKNETVKMMEEQLKEVQEITEAIENETHNGG